MKRTAIFGLFIAAALLVSPVFAADDDCAANLQELKDDVMAAGDIGEPYQAQLEKLMGQAEKAQKADDEKTCADAIEKASSLLEKAQEGQ
jgi:hypothetical protein